MKRAQSSRKSPSWMRGRLRKEWRWRIGDRNLAGAMTQHFPCQRTGATLPAQEQQRAEGSRKANVWINSDLTICCMDIQSKAYIFTQKADTYTFILMKPSEYNMYTSPLPTSLPLFLDQRTFCPESYACLSLESLVLNGKGEMQKKRKKIRRRGGGGVGCHGNCFACQTECPATRASGNIQGDILWPLPMGTLPQDPRWASLEDFDNRGFHSNLFSHATMTKDSQVWRADHLHTPHLSGSLDPFIHDKQHLLSVTSRQQVLTL